MSQDFSFSTYVISLKDELSRRESISIQLGNLRIPFSFVDAIDMRSNKNSHSFASLSKSSVLNRPITQGEIGCALTHIKTYQEFLLSSSEWALIIEDDALLKSLSSQKISNILSSIGANVDMVVLGYSKLEENHLNSFYIKEPIKKKYSTNDIKIGLVWRNWTCGTVSYLINRAGAKKILKNFTENNRKIATIADDMLYFEKTCGVNIYHVRPLLVIENFTTFTSSIEDDRSKLQSSSRSFFNLLRLVRGVFRKTIMIFINNK